MAGGRWPPKESDSPRGSPNSKGVYIICVCYKRHFIVLSWLTGPTLALFVQPVYPFVLFCVLVCFAGRCLMLCRPNFP